MDFLRGVAILLMCFDHFMYDLSIFDYFFVDFYRSAPESLFGLMDFGIWWFWESRLRLAGHYIFATLFLLITGVSCTLTKDNGMRCARLFLVAFILTGATVLIDSVADMGATVIFGVIHCMAVSSLLYMLLDKLFKSNYALLAVGAVFIVWGIAIEWYAIDFIWPLPSETGEYIVTVLQAILGYARVGGDHFGLFPCCGVVLWGAYIGKTLYTQKRSLLPRLDGSWNKGFSYIGQRTAWIYLVHQPLIAGLIVIIGLTCGLEVW